MLNSLSVAARFDGRAHTGAGSMGMRRASRLLLAAGVLSSTGLLADERDVWMFAQWAGDHQS
ncbi:MAG TPA: hypothetical protein DGQ94_11015, partial [Pseudomonas sp.]|nr:hypothetical protein [Pseudomonas sp.]